MLIPPSSHLFYIYYHWWIGFRVMVPTDRRIQFVTDFLNYKRVFFFEQKFPAMNWQLISIQFCCGIVQAKSLIDEKVKIKMRKYLVYSFFIIIFAANNWCQTISNEYGKIYQSVYGCRLQDALRTRVVKAIADRLSQQPA